MLIGPVSYRSRQHEYPETFSHVLNHSVTPAVGESLRKERSNAQETDDDAGFVGFGELNHGFRSGRREARRHAKRGNKTKRDEAGLHGQGRDETRSHGERQHEARSDDRRQETEKSPQVQEGEQEGRNGQRVDEAQRQHAERRDAALSSNGALAYLTATQTKPKRNPRLRASDHTTIKGEVNDAGNAAR